MCISDAKICALWVFSFLRDGFTFIREIDGLQISGRERRMEKAVSTQSLVTFSLATSKRDGDTATFFISMLMGQGFNFSNILFFAIYYLT